MKIGITPFIPENIAPEDTVRLVVFDGDTKICNVDISNMQPKNLGDKLYSFGLLADVHVNGEGTTNSIRFDNALAYLKEQGVSLVGIAGDLTNIGFWFPISETEGTSYYYTGQFDAYRSICQKHGIPVYGCCGNHESYNNHNISETYTDIYGDDPTLVVNTLEKLKEYTGYGLTFTVAHKNDAFIFVGQSIGSHPMSVESLQWLYETLETNRNKRCFVFIHSYVSSESSGNPFGLHALPLFNYWGATKTSVFKSLMSHYKNTMLFHGHSHIRPEVQTQVKHVNYSTALGFRDFSLPSSASSRTVRDGALVSDGSSFCYVADAYENCVVMRGYNLLENKEVGIGQYCIDTTLTEIPEKTFVDSTGIITP